jgi:catechol 2,3-dioxygenase-like lactoylglutathione lyase family enzyme
MGISIQTAGVHHISLRVSDFERSKQFYTRTLGLPVAVETDDLCVVLAGNTALGLRGPVDTTARAGSFDPHRVGSITSRSRAEVRLSWSAWRQP